MENLVSMCERSLPKGMQPPLRRGGLQGDMPFRQQWRTGPALPEARVTQARGRGRRGYGYGP